jgi:PBP1b-binding outer membrane lipoprotein LpoB
MLILEGQLISISSKQYTDRKTGEIVTNHTAQILDVNTSGDAEVQKLKLDHSTHLEWHKVTGKVIRAEVRPWSFVDDGGKLANGFALANKKDLPTTLAAVK